MASLHLLALVGQGLLLVDHLQLPMQGMPGIDEGPVCVLLGEWGRISMASWRLTFNEMLLQSMVLIGLWWIFSSVGLFSHFTTEYECIFVWEIQEAVMVNSGLTVLSIGGCLGEDSGVSSLWDFQLTWMWGVMPCWSGTKETRIREVFFPLKKLRRRWE